MSFSGNGDNRMFAFMPDANNVEFINPYLETLENGVMPNKSSFACIYLGGDSVNAWCNRMKLVRSSKQNRWSYAQVAQNFGVGGGSRYAQWQMTGRVFCIRLYNRRLSEKELQHNYEIDKRRFGL